MYSAHRETHVAPTPSPHHDAAPTRDARCSGEPITSGLSVEEGLQALSPGREMGFDAQERALAPTSRPGFEEQRARLAPGSNGMAPMPLSPLPRQMSPGRGTLGVHPERLDTPIVNSVTTVGGRASAKPAKPARCAPVPKGRPTPVNAAYDKVTARINNWLADMHTRIAENGTDAVKAFHTLGEKSNWNLLSLQGLSVSTLATALSVLGFVPAIGVASSVASLFLGFILAANDKENLKKAMNTSAGMMMTAVSSGGRINRKLRKELKAKADRLRQDPRKYRDEAKPAGCDPEAIAELNKIQPPKNFIKRINSNAVYMKIAQDWLAGNSARRGGKLGSSLLHNDQESWEEVHKSVGSKLDLKENELLVGQVNRVMSRYGLTPKRKVTPKAFKRIRGAHGPKFAAAITNKKPLKKALRPSVFTTRSYQGIHWNGVVLVSTFLGKKAGKHRSLNRVQIHLTTGKGGSVVHKVQVQPNIRTLGRRGAPPVIKPGPGKL